ncbi:MAG: hypothetical protein HY738_12055, partial [Bacteroidia bacterium]|nr:hypothetical protein [Bacteroidia bacterium]
LDTATAYINISSYPLPVVDMFPYDSVCTNEPAFSLSGGTPEGGIYLFNQDTIETFDPQSTGTGTFNILYYYTDTNNCMNADSQFIIVSQAPDSVFAGLDTVCLYDAPFQPQGGTPSGGFYSGESIDTAGYFQPDSAGTGTHIIIYTYTNADNCSSSDTGQIYVLNATAVQFDTLPDVCISVPAFLLTGGHPDSGFYSGTGVDTAGYFHPEISGSGVHIITYSFIDTNQCTTNASQEITIFESPDITLIDTNASCQNYHDGKISATVTGGISPYAFLWSYNAQTTQHLDSLVSGVYTVTVTDSMSCNTVDSVTVGYNYQLIAYPGDDKNVCPDSSVQLSDT